MILLFNLFNKFITVFIYSSIFIKVKNFLFSSLLEFFTIFKLITNKLLHLSVMFICYNLSTRILIVFSLLSMIFVFINYLHFIGTFGLFKIFIMSTIYFSINQFKLSNYLLSDNLVNILQKVLIVLLFISLFLVISSLLEFSLFNTIYCDIVSTTIEKSVENSDGRNLLSNFEVGGGFVNSVLEDKEIPLVNILSGLCVINSIELSIIFVIINLLFRQSISNFIKKTIMTLYNRYIVAKKVDSNTTEEKNVNIEKAFNFSDKFFTYTLIYALVSLLIIKLINIYFLTRTTEDIDLYVRNYIDIIMEKRSSLIF
jgi:hypothetical protein